MDEHRGDITRRCSTVTLSLLGKGADDYRNCRRRVLLPRRNFDGRLLGSVFILSCYRIYMYITRIESSSKGYIIVSRKSGRAT
jgi:hypothetical protein